MNPSISLDTWMDIAERQAKYLRYLLSQHETATGQRRECLWIVLNVCNRRNDDTMRVINAEILRRAALIREA